MLFYAVGTVVAPVTVKVAVHFAFLRSRFQYGLLQTGQTFGSLGSLGCQLHPQRLHLSTGSSMGVVMPLIYT